MKLVNFNFFFACIFLILTNTFFVLAEDKIEVVPLINLEELSPTFEEDKTELEKIENKNITLNKSAHSLAMPPNKYLFKKTNHKIFLCFIINCIYYCKRKIHTIKNCR